MRFLELLRKECKLVLGTHSVLYMWLLFPVSLLFALGYVLQHIHMADEIYLGICWVVIYVASLSVSVQLFASEIEHKTAPFMFLYFKPMAVYLSKLLVTSTVVTAIAFITVGSGRLLLFKAHAFSISEALGIFAGAISIASLLCFMGMLAVISGGRTFIAGVITAPFIPFLFKMILALQAASLRTNHINAAEFIFLLCFSLFVSSLSAVLFDLVWEA